MNETEHVNFQEFFNERLRERGFTAKKLADVTGLNLKDIEHLSAGRYEKLPAAPYLRGHLIRIGQVLDFNGETWWERLKEEEVIWSSGPSDELPKNRFAKKPIDKKIWIAAAALILVAFLGWRLPKIMGKPVITVENPSAERSETTQQTLEIRGYAENSDQLFINGKNIPLGEKGIFQESVTLKSRFNTFEIIAKRFLGRETKVVRQIIYSPLLPASNTPF